MTDNHLGFTLIELMIAMAIIGILVAIAIPSYQDYVVRAKVYEGIQLSSRVKQGVSEFHQFNGVWPADNDTAGIPAPESITSNYVSKIEVGGSIISIFYTNDPKLSGKFLNLIAVTTGGSFSWRCASVTIEAKWLPRDCR